MHDGIQFNRVLLTWSFYYTLNGMHSNADVTVGAFVIACFAFDKRMILSNTSTHAILYAHARTIFTTLLTWQCCAEPPYATLAASRATADLHVITF